MPLTQLVSWGILLYAVSALVVPMQNAEGWSRAAILAGPAVGLCVAVLCAPTVGRAIEAEHARILFSGGTLPGVASLPILSLASSIEVFILSRIGIAQAATLVLELLGTLRFGRMIGLLAAAQTLMEAASPVTAGLLWSAGNNCSAVLVLLSIMVLTSLTMVVAARLASHNRAPGT